MSNIEDFPHRFESLLRGALNTEHRNQFYGIDADSLHSTEGIWQATWATLTAIQYANPEKKEDIHELLEEYYGLNKNKNSDEWDEELLQKFHDDLEALLK